MDYFLLAGGLISFAFIAWMLSGLSWIQKQDEAKIKFVETAVAQKKAMRNMVHRSGFGRNPYQHKARCKSIEKQMDKIIKDAIDGAKLP